MNSNHLWTKIGGAILASSLLFGIAPVSGPSARAQDPDRDRRDRRERDRDDPDRDRRGNDSYRVAQDRGY